MSAIMKWVLGSILIIIVALKNNEAILSTSYKDPDHLCYGGERDEVQCPSYEECECVKRNAFRMRSREYEGNIVKQKALADGSPCEHRVRRDAMAVTKEERRRYINALKTLTMDPRYQRKYYDLLISHKYHFCKALHCNLFFLPWHRWFILGYENLLREVDPNVTLIYWDWSVVMGTPWDIDLWDDNDYSFGGNGNASYHHVVDTGAFKIPEWKMVPGSGPHSNRKMTRYFNYTNPDIPSALHLALLFKLEAHEAVTWLTVSQSWHNNIHCASFGWPSTMCHGDAAWTPEFFLHHAFLDKYWSEWQEKGDDYMYIDFYMKQTRIMQGSDYLPRDILDLKYQEGNVCVTYEESPHDWLHKKLRNLTMDQLRDIRGIQVVPLTDPGTKYFDKSHALFINTTNDFIKNNGLRHPIRLDDLSGTDRARGFRLEDLLAMSGELDDITKYL